MVDTCSPKGQALVRAKNTFLEFKFFPCDTSDPARRGSEPSPTAKFDAEEVMLMMEWSSEASTAECGDLVLWSSEDLESEFDANEIAVPEDSLEGESNYNIWETGTLVCDDSDRLRHDSTPSYIGSVEADEQVDTLFSSEFSLRTKNTFLEFKLIPCDTSDRVRRSSEPSPTAKLEADEVKFTIGWNSDPSTKEYSGGVFWTPEDLEPDSDANESKSQEDSMSEYCDGMLSSSIFSLRTKNTFLDLKCRADDDSANMRRLSAPACLLQTSLVLAPPSNADESLQTSAELFEEDSWEAEAEDHMSTSRKAPSKAKRDRERGRKRLRSKKLLSHLCAKIDEDPEGFDMALIEWPQSVIDNYVVDALKAHKAKAVQELASKRTPVQLCFLSS